MEFLLLYAHMIHGVGIICRSNTSDWMEAPPMVSNSELDCIREIIDLLCPFEKLTKEFLGVREVVENLEPKNGKIQALKVKLKKQLAILNIPWSLPSQLPLTQNLSSYILKMLWSKVKL